MRGLMMNIDRAIKICTPTTSELRLVVGDFPANFPTFALER